MAMVRGSFVGATDYSHQSFEDIRVDLAAWRDSLATDGPWLSAAVADLEKTPYWEEVPFDFKALLGRTLKCFDTAFGEISEILDDLDHEVREDHPRRLRAIGATADDLNRSYGSVWYRQIDRWRRSQYGKEEFTRLETLYSEARDIAGDLVDLDGAARRLEDFVGRKPRRALKLSPEYRGFGIDLKVVWQKLRRFIGL